VSDALIPLHSKFHLVSFPLPSPSNSGAPFTIASLPLSLFCAALPWNSPCPLRALLDAAGASLFFLALADFFIYSVMLLACSFPCLLPHFFSSPDGLSWVPETRLLSFAPSPTAVFVPLTLCRTAPFGFHSQSGMAFSAFARALQGGAFRPGAGEAPHFGSFSSFPSPFWPISFVFLYFSAYRA